MRRDARSIFEAGLRAVHAGTAVKNHCRLSGSRLHVGEHDFDTARYDHLYVTGAGKATASMARGLEDLLGRRITSGIVTVKYGHAEPLHRVQIVEAAHPVPDENGCAGARRILALAERAGQNDLVICLLSGGGSALLPLPAPPLTLAEKQETIRQLLACGADIGEINAIRKHISAIKGGQLARAAAPATMLTLILSDVVGDRLEVIASGPTVADTRTFGDCLEIIRKYRLAETLPAPVLERLRQGADGRVPETPKPGELPEGKNVHRLVGSNFAALSAAAGHAAELGYRTLILSSMIEGDTRDAARFHAAVARQARKTGHPVPPPACLISGGETTVRVRGTGTGGRNQEFCLAAAMQIAGEGNMVILSGGTDGTDGPTDAAGAVVDADTVARAGAIGLDAGRYLEDNDSYHFFEKTGELLITGPTGTNVMDLRIMLVG